MSEYLSPKKAYEQYDLRLDPDAERSELEKSLESSGIAAIEMPLSSDDFQKLSQGMAVCIEECPDTLAETFYQADPRYGGEVGYVRKDKKYDRRTGIQTDDPKHYFHFMENSRDYWRTRFKKGPKVLRDFLEDGFEVHDAMIQVAKKTVTEMENSHPNMNSLYFPNQESFSFLRVLRYDGYQPYGSMTEVAKPHYDIGGITLQAYADTPGFWAMPESTRNKGSEGIKAYFNTAEHQAYVFLGKGHEKVYGSEDVMKPLWHGVARNIPTGVTFVPERTAVILFVDAPEVDYHVRKSDTLPQLGKLATTMA